MQDPQGQHDVYRHHHHGKPGVLQWKKQERGADLLYRGCRIYGEEDWQEEYFLRRRPHGRKDAASASLLYAHYRGWTVIRERDIRQPGAAVPMAGRVSRPHEKAFPVLKRGESALVTKRKHIPTWMFKQSVDLIKQQRAIEKAVSDIGMMNAGKKRDEILTLVGPYFARLEGHLGQMKKY